METKLLNAQMQDAPKSSNKLERDPMAHNIESILAFYAREEQNLSRSQRLLESMLASLGKPVYIALIIFFCIVWILVNIFLEHLGFSQFDEPPYHWLQGIIGLAGLLIAVIVLIKQNRMERLDERRAHLELQVNLLTEHKAAKLIKLMMELRRDMPLIKNKRDPLAAAFQKPTAPEAILAALEEHLRSEWRNEFKEP